MASAGPRILMLHGWTQNAEVFQGKSQPFTRKLRQLAHVHYMSAPHKLPSGFHDREDARAWFRYHQDDVTYLPEGGIRGQWSIYGWSVARRAIAAEWLEHGPFDGICGFSQGAVAAHLLLAELEAARSQLQAGPDGPASTAVFHDSEDTDWLGDLAPILSHPPKFAILVCGFPARYQTLLNAKLTVKSLHVVSEEDTTVPCALHRALAEQFVDAELLVHDKGHCMPQKGADMAMIQDFVRKSMAA
jgi:pimeloyl-ACP methyl ester carboxylesterase